MRNPNGFGCVTKLSGNRRKPYVALVTTGYEVGLDPKKIEFLRDILSAETFAKVQEEFNEYNAAHPKAKQKQTPIGYYETRKDALMGLAEYNRNPYDLDIKKTTFEEVFCKIEPELEKLSKSAYRGYKGAYKHYEPIHKKRLSSISTNDMQKCIDDSPTCQKHMVIVAHKIYEYALAHDLAPKDYSQYLKETFKRETKEKQPFTPQEVQLLWDNIEWKVPHSKRLTNGQYVDVLLILIYTGMRISELLAVNYEDVHLEDRIIDVHGTKTKNADRIVPIHKDIIPFIEKRMEEGKPLIRTNQGNRMTYTTFLNDFYSIFAKEFQLEHTIHDTRHSFISYANMSGLNHIMLKKMVGHSANDINIDTYTHIFAKSLVEEIDKFEIKELKSFTK